MVLAADTFYSARANGETGSSAQYMFNFELAHDHAVIAEGGRPNLEQQKPPYYSSNSLNSYLDPRHSLLPFSPAAEHIVCAACKSKASNGVLRGDRSPDRSPCPSPRSTPTSPSTSVLGKRGKFLVQ